jgi:diketogulonate reductase-like aldo/keto reductase
MAFHPLAFSLATTVCECLGLVTMFLIVLLVERGHSVLAKSVTPTRIKANYQVTKLDREDMDALAQVLSGGNLKRHGNPPWKVNLGFPDQQ